jgi:hypothetical protein
MGYGVDLLVLKDVPMGKAGVTPAVGAETERSEVMAAGQPEGHA